MRATCASDAGPWEWTIGAVAERIAFMHRSQRSPASSRSFELVIEKLVFGGEGLGHHEGKVVFVPFTAPGDRVEVRPLEHKKNFLRASVVRLLQPGPGRREPSCPYFGRCGGCQWQHIEYELQVETKRRILEELSHHRLPATGRIPIAMEASPLEYGYRSRARVQLRRTGPDAQVGFYRYHSRAVEDIASCPLFRPALNQALDHVRHAHREGEFGSEDRELDLACAEDGTWRFADAGDAMPEAGPDSGEVLCRSIGEFEYAVAPSAFFQANDSMLSSLIARVRDIAGSGLSALDLYSGVGFFSLPLARSFQNVVAVEGNLLAHRCCILNQTRARQENIRAVCADVRDWMGAAASMAPPAFDLILLDPPRSGAGPEVMRRLMEWTPETIVYVSCDPQTLIRDLAMVPATNYKIDIIAGLDLFPQTSHIETVVRLTRSGGRPDIVGY